MRQQIFVNGKYEFDFEMSEGKLYTLYFAEADTWAVKIRGGIAFQIQDDGNGYNTLNSFQDFDKINYSEFQYLQILLRLIGSENVYEIGYRKSF